MVPWFMVAVPIEVANLPAPCFLVLLYDEVGDVLHRLHGRVGFLFHAEHEIGAIKALHEHGRLHQAQALGDIGSDLTAMRQSIVRARGEEPRARTSERVNNT